MSDKQLVALLKGHSGEIDQLHYDHDGKSRHSNAPHSTQSHTALWQVELTIAHNASMMRFTRDRSSLLLCVLLSLCQSFAECGRHGRRLDVGAGICSNHTTAARYAYAAQCR